MFWKSIDKKLYDFKKRTIINNTMLNNLSEILKEGTTNFKVICHEWNKNNPNNTVDINATLPNYNNLH